MILKEISILNYKNIEETHLELSPKMNCIVGHNGEGKTNVLDAIYYLSFCKSSSNPIDAQVIRHEAESMMLKGIYETEDGGEEQIVCGLQRHHKKVFKLNDKPYRKLSEHIGHIRLVIVSPDDTELIAGGSECRRHFMDMVIVQYDPEYLHQLLCYRKALQQRNLLLRQEAEPDDDFISVYEQQMAQSGAYIYEQRAAFIEEFKPIFNSVYAELAVEDENVDLVYHSHGERGDLLAQIRDSRPKDRILGFSLTGPHRDDLEMSLHGFPIKREGSQGQNKTYVIALKLSQFEFLKNKGNRRMPILLLDDIFDKLDTRRVEHIVRMVSGDGYGQIFITDTNPEFLDKIFKRVGQEFRLFSVQGGALENEV